MESAAGADRSMRTSNFSFGAGVPIFVAQNLNTPMLNRSESWSVNFKLTIRGPSVVRIPVARGPSTHRSARAFE